MELDHIFLFAKPGSNWKEFLSSMNLVPTYIRIHPGQGTANLCFCFENAFLEILWVENISEIDNDPIKRCKFGERSKWSSNIDTSPFGIAWRGQADIKTWIYRPPYLPNDKAILVAVDSDDIQQPFMFTFPGTFPPKDWPITKKGELQSSSGYSKIFIEELILPKPKTASESLLLLHEKGCIESLKSDLKHSVILRLENINPELTKRFSMPDFQLI